MRVSLTVNGVRRTADDVWPGESLLFTLRERLALPGSKNACEQGECGSCTVLLDGLPVCSCLVAAPQAEGATVVTVEGLAPSADRLHPVQEAFVARPVQSNVDSVRPGWWSRWPTCWTATRPRPTSRPGRRWPATCAAAPGTRRSSTRSDSRLDPGRLDRAAS